MSKGDRQRTAREKLAEDRKRQAARDRRNRGLLIGLGALVVVAVVVAAGVYFATKKEKRSQVAGTYKGQLAPVSRQADGSILMSQPNVKTPSLEIFEDFQCPNCQAFEKTSGGAVKKLAASGKVSVVYRPFQLFQQKGDPRAPVSRRGANAALCAPADKWVSFHDALYQFQPPEGKNGFTNKDLKNWGADLGLAGTAFDKCVDDTQKAAQLDQMTKYTSTTRGVQSTPTVFLNGKSVPNNVLLDPNSLEQAITAGAKPGNK